MSNDLDDISLDKNSFAYRDILGQDAWATWTVTYSFATATGLTVLGRYRIVGRMCYAQVQSSGTSIATTAGASYIALPVPAKGYGGQVIMFNSTTNIAVGVGGIDVANSRAHLPTQGASANTFVFSFNYEC